MQEKNRNIGPLYKLFVAGKRPALNDIQMESAETRNNLFLWDSIWLIDGVVYREFHKKDGTGIFTVKKGHYVPNA